MDSTGAQSTPSFQSSALHNEEAIAHDASQFAVFAASEC